MCKTREKSNVVSETSTEKRQKEAGGSQTMDACKDCEFILKAIQKH